LEGGERVDKICVVCEGAGATLQLDDDNYICEDCAQIMSELAPD